MSANPKETEFLHLIQKHQGILHKTCFMYSRDQADREDLYQEIVLQLWKSFPSFRGQAAFSTWMYRVVLNTAITMTRKPNLFTDTGKVPVVPCVMDDPDGVSEDIQTLYKAISQLNKVEKGIILLWLEERSYGEIADIMGLTVKNVSVKLVRIKARLAEIIKKIQ
jgi:RNA polymerase sigma-70 factor (ECF subfamily)